MKEYVRSKKLETMISSSVMHRLKLVDATAYKVVSAQTSILLRDDVFNQMTDPIVNATDSLRTIPHEQ